MDVMCVMSNGATGERWALVGVATKVLLHHCCHIENPSVTLFTAVFYIERTNDPANASEPRQTTYFPILID